MLRKLLEDGTLMEYLKESGLHDFSCAAWDEGQSCCLEDERIIEILLALLKDQDG